MFGVKDRWSRRAFKRPVRYLTNSPQLLTFVVRKCPNKHVHGPVKGLTNAYWSSSRWHTRAWAQAVIRGVESDAVQRRGACPAEDVQVDVTGAHTPDDEFPEEPPNRYPTGQLAILVPTRIWDTPARNCFVALCELVERTRSRFERRTNSSAENKPLKSHVPSKLAVIYTEFNQGVGVDLFVLAEFLNTVDLARRFNICFPVPSKKAG